MNEADFRDHVRRLKEAVRGRDVVARIGLRGRGKPFFCPECQPAGGKTPDLDVFDKGFRCYKCGKTGDIIDLAVLAGGMSKADAIEYLEQLAGKKIEIPPIKQVEATFKKAEKFKGEQGEQLKLSEGTDK